MDEAGEGKGQLDMDQHVACSARGRKAGVRSGWKRARDERAEVLERLEEVGRLERERSRIRGWHCLSRHDPVLEQERWEGRCRDGPVR